MFRLVRLLMFGGLLGKGLGIARELITGWLFGTGTVASSYRMAQSAFLIPLNGFASDALNGALTPRMARHAAMDRERAGHLFAGMHVVVLVVSLLTGLGMFLLVRQWVGLLAPGFNFETAALTIDMVCIMTMGMVPHFLCSLYASVDLAHGGGRLTALRASVQSAGLVSGTVLAWWLAQPLWIPAGFVAAQWALAAWGCVVVRRLHYRFWPTTASWSLVKDELTHVWRAFRVLVWVPMAMQLHFIVERQVASLVHPEAVAALDYARFLSDTAVYLLAMPFGMAGLAAMASMAEEEFKSAAARSMRLLLVVTVPLSAITVAHAEWVVRLLFARGAFDEESVALTSAVLRCMGIGMWAQVLTYASLKFLNARGRHGLVLAVTVCGALLNAGLNYWGWQQLGPSVLGLSAALNAIFMLPLIVWSLSIGRRLAFDVAYFGVSFIAYVAFWHLIGAVPHELILVPLVAGACWATLVLAPRRYRQMFLGAVMPRRCSVPLSP